MMMWHTSWEVALKTRADAAIVGAGIVGLFCAYFLARRGLDVVVLERKVPGAGSSTRNGGGVRYQFGTSTNVRLSLLSEPYWADFENRFGVDISLRRIGHIFMAVDESELAALHEHVSLQNELGVPSEVLSSAEMSARWPSLGGLGFTGGNHCATGGYLNQHRALTGIAEAVRAAGGAIECGVDVVGFEVAGGRIVAVGTTNGTVEADVVVNCAGGWAPLIAAELGIEIPIRSRRVQLLYANLDRPLPTDLPWLIGPLGQVHIRQDSDGRALVGGFLNMNETVDPRAFDHDAGADWIVDVLNEVRRMFAIDIDRSGVVEAWAGLYPSTPDQHPIIDTTEAGLVIVGGFAGLGLMHAPAAGLLASELIMGGRMTSLDGDLSLDRFAQPSDSAEPTGF